MEDQQLSLIKELQSIVGLYQRDIAKALNVHESKISRAFQESSIAHTSAYQYRQVRSDVIGFLSSEISKGNVRDNVTERDLFAVINNLHINTGLSMLNYCTGISNLYTLIHKKREPNASPKMTIGNLKMMARIAFFAFDFARTLEAMGKMGPRLGDKDLLDLFYEFTKQKLTHLELIIKNPAEAGHVRDN